MNFAHLRRPPLLAAAVVALSLAHVQAGDAPGAPATSESRYGLFGLLDRNSSYGKGLFPEPFLIDDSDLEEGEIRFDWLRTARGSSHTDNFRVEIEKSLGPVTLELEVPYERNVAPGERVDGIANIDLGARVPVFQWVNQGKTFDTTFGVAFEWGIPNGSAVSKNGELVPKIFNDTRFGLLTLQTVAGLSFVTGPGEAGGSRAFEYGFTLGFTIDHKVLPIPGVQQIIPVFELSGEHGLNKEEEGVDNLTGLAGVRINLDSIGKIQPRLGVGYVFPLNNIAREDFHSGVYTSLVFEF
ncbi:MAG TPA: hypothetical protein VGO11_03200 [Chthoniobacteraceae bacterium]|nr:hypothetical protein [Chthoniobacteraceae bacterium]